MADILYDTRLKSEKAPKVIILTHGDADGLVSAMIVRAFEELQNKKKTFLIISSILYREIFLLYFFGIENKLYDCRTSNLHHTIGIFLS